MTNMDGVLQHILIVLDETPLRWNSPHPNPSPEGEGLEKLPPSPSGEGPGVGPVRDEAQEFLGIGPEGSVG
jgi:hypothetical protein